MSKVKPQVRGTTFHIPADPMRVELEQIKQRQRNRKTNGIPKDPSNEYLAQMLSDVLENLARVENQLNAIIAKWK